MKVAVILGEFGVSIRVKPSTATTQVAKPEGNELEIQGDTLRELLIRLADRSDIRGIVGWFIVSQTNEVSTACHISINGNNYRFLPRGISTKLKEGDEVDIIIPTELYGGG